MTRPHLLSTPYIVFLVIAAAAPLASMIGNLPIAIARGSGAYVPIGFLIAGLILLLFTAGFSFIAHRLVKTGAFYAYIAEGLGKPFGVGAAYCAVISYSVFAFGLAAASGYFEAQVFKALGFGVSWSLCAAASILLTSWLTSRSMEASSKLLGLIIIVETAVLAVFDICVIWAKGSAALPLSVFALHGWLAPGLGVSLMTAFSCFVGFESAALYGKEAANPKRSIPLATSVSVVLISGFYLATAWIAIGALGVKTAQSTAIAHGGTLMLDLITRFEGQIGGDIAGVLVCTSILATYIAIHAAAARYLHALADEGLLPRILARFDDVRKVPQAATLCLSVITAIVLCLIVVSHAKPYKFIIPVLIGTGTAGIIALQATASIAIVFYAAKHRTEAGLAVVVASCLAALGLCVALATVCANFSLLSNVDSRFVTWLPSLYLITFVTGLVYSLWLRWRRPLHYAALALDK